MSILTDMIDGGRDNILMDVAGEAFTVDGITGSFVGLFADLSNSNDLSGSGLEPFGNGTLAATKSTRWLPKVGQLVNIRSMQYRISGITNDPTHYRLSLALPNS